MGKKNVIAIFDIGKTNKKFLLFDEDYSVIHESSQTLDESVDHDGFPCENVDDLSKWVLESFNNAVDSNNYQVSAVNCCAYGATLVHLNNDGNILMPIYNYLKPFPEALKNKFYNTYGGEAQVAKETASPVLGSLNSGLQLYRLKHESFELFDQVKYSLHLPQFIMYLITGLAAAEITSIGCHTHLWNFEKNDYHDWVRQEELHKKFPPLISSEKVFAAKSKSPKIPAGIGLHDSSAALIPYLFSFQQPFILLSTGTWCISLNPFNHSDLTMDELNQDCLCFLNYKGSSVKASRLFAGNMHDRQVKRLAAYFNTREDYFTSIAYNAEIVKALIETNNLSGYKPQRVHGFINRELEEFYTYEEAYHCLIMDIIYMQKASTELVMNSPVKHLYVDGGFSRNRIFMQLLANAFPNLEVHAAEMSQGSALGAALAIHDKWNKIPFAKDLIKLKFYSPVAIN